MAGSFVHKLMQQTFLNKIKLKVAKNNNFNPSYDNKQRKSADNFQCPFQRF